MTKKLAYLLGFALLIFVYACEEDEDPLIENEEEVITMATLTLFPNGPQETVTIGFSDPDGDGGMAPEFSQTGELVANGNYRGQMSFGNTTGSINAEIVEEGLEHQVFYQSSGGLNLDISYQDTDVAANPIGLVTQIIAGAAGSGQLTITLRHEPDKTAAGLSISNPDAAGGSTDVEITFDLTVQ